MIGRQTLSLVLVLGSFVGPAAAQETVRSVQIVSDTPVGREQVLAALGLAEGAPLDRTAIREGLHVLFAAGSLESARIEATKTGEGSDISVRLWIRPRVDAVNVEAESGRWRRRIRGWLDIRSGDWFSAAGLEAAVARIRRRLAERGFAAAEVEPFVTYSASSNTVAVSIEVRLGEPQRLAGIELRGIDDPDGKIAAAAGVSVGDRLTPDNEERIRGRIEGALRAAGMWEADILGMDHLPAERWTTLVIRVSPGPSYRLHVEAPASAQALLEKVLPDPTKEAIHPSQTSAVNDRILESLQARGYLLATVAVDLDTTSTERTLRVTVTPGRRRRVAEVAFPGASGLDAGKLAKTVAVHRGRLGGWRGQTVTHATLDADRAALVALYHRHGYAGVGVQPAVLQPVADDGVRVLFPVSEGRRWMVEELRLEGFPVEAAGAVESRRLPLAAHGPWDPDLLRTTERLLETALADAGYPEGSVTAHADTSEAGKARVTVTADPGPFVTISRVVIAGLKQTREIVVRRIVERAGVRTGAPYSLQAFLTAQRKLYELGIFRRIELVPVPGQERRTSRGVVVRCEEGLQRSYLLGVGWDTVESAHITLGWSHLNLFGGAHALSVESRVSGRETRYQLGLRESNLAGLGVPAFAALYRTEEEFSAFSQKRRGLWIEVGDRRRRPFRPWLRYEYQIVDPDAPPDVLSDLERQDQEVRESSITPTIEWDTRDDPFLPSRGLAASLSVEYAFPLLNATARFLKAEARFSMYRPLAAGTGALSVDLGAIHPIAVGGAAPANLKVPINERFFAGGPFTHRAFATDRLGIAGQTVDPSGNAIGGNGLLLINAEYRRKIRGPFSAALFLDAGNVWSEPALVRWKDMRWGAGLAFRVDTPAGPLRLEYGVKLDRKPGESHGELFVAFGSPF